MTTVRSSRAKSLNMPGVRGPSRLTPADVQSVVSATTEQLLRRLDALTPDDPGRSALRVRAIEENLPMARRLAHRYGGRGEAYDDLAQVAALALVKAVDGYDPQRDSLFVSYAIPTILGALKRHFRDSAWGLRVPRAMQELVLLVRATSGELAHQLGRPPTSVELAGRLDLTLDSVLAAAKAGHAYRPASLDEAASIVDSGGRANLVRVPGVIDPRFAAVDNALMVRSLVAALPDRERRIVIMRFYLELTQTQIAAAVGVSQMQVSRLLREILAQLQVAVAKA